MTTRKRIAFIVNHIFPYRLSFYEKLYAHDEYEWLFVHGIKKKEDGRPTHQGVLNFPTQATGYAERKVGPFYLRWQAGVLAALRRWQPDIVITQGIASTLTNWLAMDWTRRNSGKSISWHCAWEPQSGNPRSLMVKKKLVRPYLRMADHTLAYSTTAAKYLAELGCKPHKITVCYNGLEIDHLLLHQTEVRAKAHALREQHGLGGKKLFLYVGGMMSDKKVPLLLDAFQSIERYNNAALWLVGDGPDLHTIKSLAESKGLKSVKFWGRIIDDVDACFAASDYFVLPGVGGLALNQALFWGVPCVAGEADGTEDDLVFDGKTGFRFASRDSRSLAEAMLRCTELSDSCRAVFGNTGRELVLQRSNVNEMVKTFIRTIETL